MPAPHIDNEHASPPHSGSTSFDSRLARIRAKTDTGLTVISISGEIDASNADDVSRHVRELASDCGALIVDLAEVDFIALDGLHALIALNDAMRPHRHNMGADRQPRGEPAPSSGRSRHATSRRRLGDRGPTTAAPIQAGPPITAAR